MTQQAIDNEVVSIDGKQYKVKGVESYALLIIHKGSPIGLLVEPFEPMEEAK